MQNEFFRNIPGAVQNRFFQLNSFAIPDPQKARNIDILGSFGMSSAHQLSGWNHGIYVHEQNRQNEKLQYGSLHPSHPSYSPHLSQGEMFGTKRQHLSYYEVYDNTAIYPEYVVIVQSL